MRRVASLWLLIAAFPAAGQLLYGQANSQTPITRPYPSPQVWTPLNVSQCLPTGGVGDVTQGLAITTTRASTQTALDLSLTCPADSLLVGVNGAEVLASPATRATVPIPTMTARWCWVGTVLIVGGAGGTANNVTFAIGDDGNGWRMVTGVIPFSDGAPHRVSVCADAGTLTIRDGATVVSGATTGTGTGYWTPQPGQYAGIASDKGNMQLGGALKDWRLYLNQPYRTGL